MTCEFSLSHYSDILDNLKGRAGSVTERKDVILTHDVDIFPPYALETARIEAIKGIRATYYVLPHSEWYNAFSPENIAIWQTISRLGHEIALHYDGRFDFDLEKVHAGFCAMLKTNSVNVSQHLVGITPEIRIPSYLYDRSRLLKEGYSYIADSGGWWRKGCICESHERRLLFVSHSVWWVKGANPFGSVAKDAYRVIDRAQKFWEDMVDEHRKQKIQVQSRS